MLGQAFQEESNMSLFVDLLTYADLELLRARKSGASTASVGLNISAATANKRYIILTYSGEFDRVHYPLPLVFEDPNSVNVNSLKRTINRLRAKVKTLSAEVNTKRGTSPGRGSAVSEEADDDKER
jgi:coiled-coil domain-containing protein 61